jgi:hypothetical protein
LVNTFSLFLDVEIVTLAEMNGEEQVEVKESGHDTTISDDAEPAVATATADQTSVSSQTSENDTKDQQDFPVSNAVDFDVTVHDDGDAVPGSAQSTPISPSSTNAESPKSEPQRRRSDVLDGLKRRKGKRGRTARIAQVTDETKQVSKRGLSLPANQYRTTLHRRFVRKKDESVDKTYPSDSLEEYGDTSLGMKLSVVGGKVIVQILNCLGDGRASPAQLVGVIKRGDVLLSINGVSLVSLPIDQLMGGLSPLSTPDASGLYQRRLDLRLEAGGGMDLLLRSEKEAAGSKRSQSSVDLASDMFSLFPMVDNLSGVPMFDADKTGVKKEEKKETPVREATKGPVEKPVPSRNITSEKTTNERMSLVLAALKQKDRNQAMSAFFAWNKKHSRLLRCDDSTVSSVPSMQSTESSLTKEQFIERGKRAILGASALTKQVETIDSGKDVRSFQSWKTTLSLNSRAGSRRRYVLDVASLPLNFGKAGKDIEEEEESEDANNGSGSIGSSHSGDEENLDGDELLLRLAAHDEIWRKQVIECLEESAANLLSEKPEEEPAEEKYVKQDLPTTNDFSSFLFGENVSKILSKRKKTKALPPEEVTSVLFDLSTKLSASVPDEITAAGMQVSFQSNFVPFRAMKHPAPGSQVMLATQYLVDDALPAWAKTFRPLPWDQRRVLWPVYKQSQGGSSTATTVSDDLLTIDSMSTGFTSISAKHRKNLREQIEEQELDAETREETCVQEDCPEIKHVLGLLGLISHTILLFSCNSCFLLTYLFTQSLLPQFKDRGQSDTVVEKLKDFVRQFGAYLKLHTCLAYAASLKAEAIVEILLDLAKHDPRHREVMKLTSKIGSLVLYEPVSIHRGEC